MGSESKGAGQGRYLITWEADANKWARDGHVGHCGGRRQRKGEIFEKERFLNIC